MSAQSLPQPSSSRLVFSEPQLFTSDIERALDFYVTKLGFGVAFKYGDPPHYAQVVRDQARLNLRHSGRPAFDPKFRELESDALSATIIVEGPGALFDELCERGAEFHRPLKTEPWGAQTFIVSDPDGNLVCFAGG